MTYEQLDVPTMPRIHAGEQVRVLKEDSKFFNKLGVVTAAHSPQYIRVKFGGRGRPPVFNEADLEVIDTIL